MIICFCRNDNHVASIPRIVLDDNGIERVTQANVTQLNCCVLTRRNQFVMSPGH